MSAIRGDSYKFKCFGQVKDYDKTLKLEMLICIALKNLVAKSKYLLLYLTHSNLLDRSDLSYKDFPN